MKFQFQTHKIIFASYKAVLLFRLFCSLAYAHLPNRLLQLLGIYEFCHTCCLEVSLIPYYNGNICHLKIHFHPQVPIFFVISRVSTFLTLLSHVGFPTHQGCTNTFRHADISQTFAGANSTDKKPPIFTVFFSTAFCYILVQITYWQLSLAQPAAAVKQSQSFDTFTLPVLRIEAWYRSVYGENILTLNNTTDGLVYTEKKYMIDLIQLAPLMYDFYGKTQEWKGAVELRMMPSFTTCLCMQLHWGRRSMTQAQLSRLSKTWSLSIFPSSLPKSHTQDLVQTVCHHFHSSSPHPLCPPTPPAKLIYLLD